VHFRRDADRLATAEDVRRLIDLHFPDGGDSFELDPALAGEGREAAE
jgi:hypothetical protein